MTERGKSKGKEAGDLLRRSRAWLVEGHEKLRAGDTKGGIASAQAGLDLLGHDYMQPDAEDDTGLTLAMASYKITRGEEKQGAELMLRVLKERIDSFAELHALE